MKMIETINIQHIAKYKQRHKNLAKLLIKTIANIATGNFKFFPWFKQNNFFCSGQKLGCVLYGSMSENTNF